MFATCKKDLLNFLEKPPKKLDVVVMPDFFLDRSINIDCDAPTFFSMVKDVVERKGGSLDNIAQTEVRGGNAINTASALAALGAKVTPIVCTNSLGLQQINHYLGQYHVDTSHIKIRARASLTTALEFKTDTGKTNVMLIELGSLVDFGPSILTDNDYKLIEQADYVCLFNWVGTKKFGTELASRVFFRVKAKGKGKTYYDTADPTPKRDKIPQLMEKVLKTPQVDVLSVNENEAISYAAVLGNETAEQRGKLRLDETALIAARVLAKHLDGRIDLHATSFSATFTKKRETVIPVFNLKPLRATGAGDAWNAGNIIGDGNALSDECRLTLANAVAACYLVDPEGMHPTRQKLIKFLENSSAAQSYR